MAEDAIGRGDYILGVDNTGVKKGTAEAEQAIQASADKAEGAYADAGEKAANAYTKAIGTGLKLVGGIVASGLALATKGTLELTNVTADFRAETGATAEEADRAGDAINRMSGRNIAPIGEIGRALTKVHTDMGLVGVAAEDMTQRFLTFARATKQDAAAAVLDFDGILDAWGLTAKDAQAIMDKLIVSHQKYGGSLEANQRALAAMAPQLRALNLDIDDGIGLLNLFASSGLDAAAGQQALNTAIAKLPAGESLDQFLKRLAAVKNDGERARLAMEVFGIRAGAKLANAIRPGIDSLDDFKVTTEQATGATQEAADALDSTFGARMQLLLKGFASELTGVGKELGPLVTTLAGLASIGGALGADRLVAKLGPKLVEAFKVIGMQAGDALGDGIGAVVSGAQGTVLGNFIASRIEVILNPTQNSRLAGIYRAAAAAGGALYGVTFGAAMKLGEVVAGVLVGLPGAGVVRSAILASALALGGAYGTAIALAMKGAILAGVVAIADWVKPMLDSLAKNIHEAIFQGPLEGVGNALEGVGRFLNDLPWPLGPKGAPDWARMGGEAEQGAWQVGKRVAHGIGEGVGSIPAAIRDASPAARAAAGDLAAQVAAGIAPLGGRIVDDLDISDQIATAKIRNQQAVADMAGALARELASKGSNLRAVSAALAAKLPEAIQNNRDEVRRQAVLSMVDYAAGLRDRRAQIQAAIEQIGNDLEHSLSTRQERLLLQGQLAGKNITKGLKSNDPLVKAQAQGTVQLIVDRLKQLGVDTSRLGGQAGKNYAGALADTKPIVQSAASTAASGQTKAFETYRANALKWGKNVGKAYADGLRSTYGLVNDAANYVAKGATGAFKASSPPGPESPLHHIGDWATATIAWYASRLRAGRDVVAAAAREALGGASATLSAGAVEIMSEARSLGTIRVEHTISSQGAANLAAAGFSPREVGHALAEAAGLFGNLRQLQAMTGG